MSNKVKYVIAGLASMGAAVFMFYHADAAMPDEVRWWMRYWLAGLAIGCYLFGAAYAAYLMHEGMELEKERAVEEERANTRALEDGLRAKTEQYEYERTELIAKYDAEADEANHRHTQAILAKDAEITHLKSQIANSDAALQHEREKNAELMSKVDEFESGERRKGEVWNTLNERELWCLSHVWHKFPSKFSVGVGSPCAPSFDVLSDAGILMFNGEEIIRGERARTYTPSLEWRAWISDHADELPEPNNEVPGMWGTRENT